MFTAVIFFTSIIPSRQVVHYYPCSFVKKHSHKTDTFGDSGLFHIKQNHCRQIVLRHFGDFVPQNGIQKVGSSILLSYTFSSSIVTISGFFLYPSLVFLLRTRAFFYKIQYINICGRIESTHGPIGA